MKIILWITVNSAYLFAVAAGEIGGNEMLSNAAHFFAWLTLFLAFCTHTQPGIKALAARDRSVPTGVDAMSDLLVAIIFAAGGSFITAFAVVLSVVITESAWNKSKELKGEAK